MATSQSAERSTVSLAPIASDDPLTQRHYIAQLALLLALRRALAKLWPSLDQTNLKGTIPPYATKVAALVQQYSLANIAISAEFYENSRDRAIARPGFTTPLIDPPSSAEIEDLVRGALDPLWSSSSDALARLDAIEAAETRERERTDAVEAARERAESNAEKFAADAGRNELIEAIESDTYARGFARVAKPGACSFCLLLATRGAIYKSAETAGRVAASTIWPDAKGDVNRYHPNCRCTVQPLFGSSYEAPAHIRDAEALYLESTKNITGSKAKQAAFRKALREQRKQTSAA